ncbi:MAG: response regulator [Candidatus Protistobacter heckmanni]|nr:response regulator [Candidatus Protistobacter heckmanni]
MTKSKLHILIVEDQADIRQLIRFPLEPEGYRITEASDAEEALARREPPDAVVLDVLMPGGMSGLSLCRIFRSEDIFSKIAIILLSARAQSADISAGMDAGAYAYLTKPFSPIELIKVLAQALQDAVRTEQGCESPER